MKERIISYFKIGKDNKEIAKLCDVSIRTVERHRKKYNETLSSDSDIDDSKLTTKEKAFADNLIANKGKKGQAAKDAGYSEKSAHVIASENLKKPKIIEYIKARQEQLADKLQITQEFIVNELLDNALRAKGVVKTNETIVLTISEKTQTVGEGSYSHSSQEPTDCEVYKADFKASTAALAELRKMLGIGEDVELIKQKLEIEKKKVADENNEGVEPVTIVDDIGVGKDGD